MRLKKPFLPFFTCALLTLLFTAQYGSRLLAQDTNDPTAGLYRMPPEDIPVFGTFWSLKFGAPHPLNPWRAFTNVVVYLLDSNSPYGSFPSNSFLMDDRGLDYSSLGGGDEDVLTTDGGYGGPMGPFDSYYPSNALWLEVTNVSGGYASVLLHNTTVDWTYEILSKRALTNGPWISEGTVVGHQDITPTTIAISDRTNQLFLWARSLSLDSDGDGLPDYWEIAYGLDPNNPDTGNTGIPDGYKNPQGDGLNNLYKYEHGMSLGVFYTPLAPSGLTVRYTTNVVVRWNASSGSVTGYTLQKYDPSTYQTNAISLSANTNQYIDASQQVTDSNVWQGPPLYRIQALYSASSSAWSAWVPLYYPDPNPYWGSGYLIRGHQGQSCIALPAVPVNTATVRFLFDGFFGIGGTNWTVSVTNLTNNIYQVPPQFMPEYPQSGNWVAEFKDSGGRLLGVTHVGYAAFSTAPFYDGRQQLQQNLSFLLRASDAYSPFQFLVTPGVLFGSHSNYAAVSYLDVISDPDGPLTAELSPFDFNYIYRNFAFFTNDLASDGSLDSAGYEPGSGPYVADPQIYEFPGPTNGTQIAAVLSATDFPWTYFRPYYTTNAVELAAIGVTHGAGGFTLSANASNLFGLKYQSVQTAYITNNSVRTTLLNAGATIPDRRNILYPSTVEPVMKTTNYYFASQWYDPLPNEDSFSPTNPTPVLIAPIGQPYWVAGYAKQVISNGASGKFGYTGQYFEAAYKMGTNGMATTNQTGVLSEYGEFFPTEPGPTALVTMTNWGENVPPGTGIVNVIKLQLDVNHDGIMDLSLGGPDNTSTNQPFVFWVNNDFDRSHPVGSDHAEDDLASNDHEAASPYTNGPIADCEYRDTLGDRVIPSERDLEDFTRLWISGIGSNLFTWLPPGVTGELSWGDKVSPNTNNPTIDLFGPADADGGIGYLTNYLSAINQTNSQYHTCQRLGPGGSVTVLSNGWANPHFIWCGVKQGSGALTLTITQGGTNTLAQTFAYIQLKDIKQMYERWTVGEAPSTSTAITSQPYLASDGLATGATQFQYARPSDTNTSYILQVHDYDLPTWKKDRFAETAFKRLYWQGYHGRFGLFRWPSVNINSFRPLDDSEFNSWRSAAGLLNLLTNLNAQYPGNVYLMAHGYGAVAAGEALRLAGTNQLVNTYIAMQGAVPSHAYDASLTNRSLGSSDSSTPNRYANYYTSGALCYFSGVGGAGTYINYFNTNDTVLTNNWCVTEDGKPDLIIGYRWSGTNFFKNITTPMFFPTNTYEIFSYCDEARCEAIGAQPNLGGPFSVGAQVDLSVLAYNFGNKEKDHSAQFLSSCDDRWEFWHAVLRSMGLKP